MASKGRDLGNIVSPQTGIAVTVSGDPVVLGVGNTEHVRVTGAGDIYLGGYLQSSTAHNTLQKIKVAPYNWTGGSTAEIASIEMGAQNTGSDDGSIIFKTATNVNTGGTLDEAMRIRYDGNVGIGTDGPLSKLHVAGGNIKVDSGYGIDFSATADGSGTTDSELLNDYEEGQWTPSITFGSGNTGLTHSEQLGQYRKIGKMVFCTVLVTLTAKGTSTGTMEINGLPFACSDANPADSGRIAGFLTFFNGFSSLNSMPAIYGIHNATKCRLVHLNDHDGTGTDENPLTNSNASDSTQFRAYISYPSD